MKREHTQPAPLAALQLVAFLSLDLVLFCLFLPHSAVPAQALNLSRMGLLLCEWCWSCCPAVGSGNAAETRLHGWWGQDGSALTPLMLSGSIASTQKSGDQRTCVGSSCLQEKVMGKM